MKVRIGETIKVGEFELFFFDRYSDKIEIGVKAPSHMAIERIEKRFEGVKKRVDPNANRSRHKKR